MTFRAVIFDIGGVLVRGEDKGRRAYWEERLGVNGIQIAEQVWLSPVGRKGLIGQASEDEVWVDVGRHFSLAAEELAELRNDFQAESTLQEELFVFIQSLRPRYKTGVISDAFQSARARVQEVFPPDCFDVMVFSAEEGLCKPDPIIFQRALERLGVSAEEAIFVDDLAHNVLGARAIGMQAIQCRETRQVIEDLSRLLGIEPARETLHA